MYISELTIHGFKSFAKKEKLQFGEGITVIVGPNGCGKTNIVDAIRWVLGEQKYSILRGSKMEDVIFNGADGLKPLNVCEATLTVHNNKGKLPLEYNDIEIGRRIYRDGSSEYFLNRTPCRLKDIQDLFVDTGMGADAYSVIELKMIEQILSETGDDRKRMFEEAAGINKYKHQRRSTLKKFDTVKLDLERINDINVEIEQKVHGLALQLKRFERHKKLAGELKNLEIKLAFLKIHEYESLIQPLLVKMEDIQNLRKINVSDETLNDRKLDQIQKVYIVQQDELKEVQKDLNSLEENRSLDHNNILVWTEQTRAARITIDRINAEIENNESKNTELLKNIQKFNLDKNILEAQIEQQLLLYKEQKLTFEKLDLDYITARKNLDDSQAFRWQTQQNFSNNTSLLERTKLLRAEKKDIAAKLKKNLAEYAKTVKDLGLEQKKLEKEQVRNQNNYEGLQKKLGAARLSQNQSQEKFNKYSMKKHETLAALESLKSQLNFYKELIEQKEGYPEGTRLILEKPADFPQVIGTVGDLFEVPELFGTAIQSALGDLAQCLVVKDRKAALEVLDSIKKIGGGKVTILPLKEASAGIKNTKIPAGPGIIGLGAELIKVKKEFKPLADLLLGRLLLVEKMNKEVQNAALWKWDLVDLDGVYAGRNLLIKNRSSSETGNIIGRLQKVELLAEQIIKTQKVSEKCSAQLELIKIEMDQQEKSIEKLIAGVDESAKDLNGTESALIRNHYNQSQALESSSVLNKDRQDLNKDITDLKSAINKLEPEVNRERKKIETLKSKIGLADKELQKLQLNRDRDHRRVQDFRIELVNLENKREKITFQKRIAEESVHEIKIRENDIKLETKSLERRIEELHHNKKESEKSLALTTAQLIKKRSLLDLKQQTSHDLYQSIEKMQNTIRTEQQTRESLLEELKQHELDKGRMEQRILLVQENIQTRYKIQVPLDLIVDEEKDDLEFQIDKHQRSMENIGPINMAVEQEHEDETERLKILLEQRDDLIGSEENLRETIQKIDRIARKQFLETFEQIKTNFKKMFSLVFEGGDADISLIGDPDPLEADISINAQPPGKRNHGLRMLSAGEKSLTAIALLFAIYQYKPSPYCILDEVDAPLDDGNIRKFKRVLSSFTGDTQFIVVTHNKITMEMADYMYGITMEKKGVSKLVSVKFDGQTYAGKNS
ncbi:MAG: chromosome segregation protein SMC [Candidatus Neomarinimicrobiota bacterium]